jgi:hypothetical protein
MFWFWVTMKPKLQRLAHKLKESFLRMSKLWVKWNSNKWFSINRVLQAMVKVITICHWQLLTGHLLKTRTFCKSPMSVWDWSLEKKGKQLKPLERDRELKKCKLQLVVLRDQRQEIFLSRVIQMQWKEWENSWTQLLRRSVKWQVEPPLVRIVCKSKSPQDWSDL